MSNPTLVPKLTAETRSLAVLMTVIVLLSLTYLGCASYQGTQNYLECRFAETSPGPDLTEMAFEPTGEKFYLHQQVEITELDVISARVVQGNEPPVVELNFTPEGTIRLAQLTASNVGRCLAMLVDGKLVSAPLIKAEIPGGRALIMGKFTLEEATQIAEKINLSRQRKE